MLPKSEVIPNIMKRAHQLIEKHLNYRATANYIQTFFTGSGPIFT